MKGTINILLLIASLAGADAQYSDGAEGRRHHHRHLRGGKSDSRSSGKAIRSKFASSTSSDSTVRRNSNSSSGTLESSPPAIVVEPLLGTDETVLGQSFKYPDGRAAITAVKITIPPGAATGPHEHSIPLFGYIVKGKLTVDYGSKGKITYRKGDSLVEAVDWPHEGRNLGKKDCELIAVYAGARDVPLSEPTKTLK
jgi:quercetin dioxygenase-like cupin family protein